MKLLTILCFFVIGTSSAAGQGYYDSYGRAYYDPSRAYNYLPPPPNALDMHYNKKQGIQVVSPDNSFHETNSDNDKAAAIDVIEIIVIIIATFIAAGGLYVAYAAFNEYRRNNKLTKLQHLYSAERDLLILSNENSYLESLWAILPDNVNGKERADLLLKVIWDIDTNNTDSFPSWSTVQDLDVILYGYNSFNDKGYSQLRQSYLLMEFILYLVEDAFEANDKGFISYKDASAFYGYLHELGGHPLFLLSVYYGRHRGFLRDNFLGFLHNELLKHSKIKHTISIIYPDFLKSDWLEQY